MKVFEKLTFMTFLHPEICNYQIKISPDNCQFSINLLSL